MLDRRRRVAAVLLRSKRFEKVDFSAEVSNFFSWVQLFCWSTGSVFIG